MANETTKLLKQAINKTSISRIFFILFLVSIFFPIRHVFFNKQAFITGEYSDFTSISLYLSDIFLFLSAIFLIPPRETKNWLKNRISFRRYPLLLLLLWITIDLIFHFSAISKPILWYSLKFLEFVVAYETTLQLLGKTNFSLLFIRLFVALATIQSILAFWQFKTQKSIGLILHKMGEGIISPKISGIAKIVSYGTTYIRGYGTFPHPNLLSAFLVTGILFNTYLLIISRTKKSLIFYGLLLLMNFIGLTVTFSRGAFLALFVSIFIFFLFFIVKTWNEDKEDYKVPLLIILTSVTICVLAFLPFLSTRDTVTDRASLERIFYAEIGLKMIFQHPFIGVGAGEGVLHMQQYSPFKLWPWQIQPVHNYFILAGAELGIPGMLILAWIFIQHLYQLIKKITVTAPFTDKQIYRLLLSTVLIGFLTLMQFDHYFYTLEQTQMLLWVILGMIGAEVRT